MKLKTSAIWNFFCEIDSNTAKCNICERIYSRKGGTTTSLKGHLKALRMDMYEELLRLEKEPRLATERDPKTQLEKAKNRKERGEGKEDPRSQKWVSPLRSKDLVEQKKEDMGREIGWCMRRRKGRVMNQDGVHYDHGGTVLRQLIINKLVNDN
ncbi:hypothetical protein J437_LFUL005564 [Ladona fulva]|uniref:BED-type domain-containing protein n=1 Tax=Ladona fulva TaxID=123851 RepID=A0A8K0P3A9_LADFU|nr:hypothetical protein J437_LFUL005564 [Ladona fulva]